MYLKHHGIIGQKWGVRRYQNMDGSLTEAGKQRYGRTSNKSIRTLSDGTQIIPNGFKLNRVGQSTIDINQSGALYVSYGEADAARYIKTLGPTPLGKLLGNAGTHIQHLSVKGDLKMPSNEVVVKEIATVLMENKSFLKSFNDSVYSWLVSTNTNVSRKDVAKAVTDPNSKKASKIAFGISSMLGDPNYKEEAMSIYSHFREMGFDALPDLNDRFRGVSETAMIVINPDKIQMKTSTVITKDSMKAAKKYVKALGKLKVNKLIK